MHHANPLFATAETPLGVELSEKSFRALERLAERRHGVPGECIFNEESPAKGAFLVRSGRIKMCLTGHAERCMILQMASAGEMLGLGASIANQGYEMTAECVTHCELLFIPRERLLQALETNLDLCVEIVSLLSGDLACAYERVLCMRRGCDHSHDHPAHHA